MPDPLFLQSTSSDVYTYAAEDFRFLVKTLIAEGVLSVQAGDLRVTPGSNLTVSVAGGAAAITGDTYSTQGNYLARWVGSTVIALAGAPAANSRIDLIVARIRDKVADSSATGGQFLEVVTGTAAASPTVPALPNGAIPLASVTVAAGQTTVTTGQITDLRTQSGAAVLRVGTQAQPMTTAQRDALTGTELFAGRLIENTSTGVVEHYTGTAWASVSSPVLRRMLNSTSVSTTSGQTYKLNWTSGDTDPGNPATGADGITVASDGRLTVSRSGLYQIHLLTSPSALTGRFAIVYQTSGGSATLLTTADNQSVSVSPTLVLPAGRYIDINFTSLSTGAGTGGVKLYITRLGD